MIFTESDILVNTEDPSQRRAWNKREASQLENVYIGQLKLLVTEIAFLTLGISPHEDLSKCVIVYAGAAGGHHIPALAQLFPETPFVLYDPAPFAIEATEQLQIIRGIFTDEIAAEWGSRKDVGIIFISDVRTSGDTSEEHESEVQANMEMQARWVELLRPSLRAYSLKFRIPYTIIEANLPFTYLGGRLIYQPYPKPDSMELRLLGNAGDAARSVTYDSKVLEQTVFYHNSIVRPKKRLYVNIFTGSKCEGYKDSQFDNGYDDTYFLYCVKHLVEKNHASLTDEDEVLAIVRRLIAITSQGRWTLTQRKAQAQKPHYYRRLR